jgi:hypothetical protein
MKNTNNIFKKFNRPRIIRCHPLHSTHNQVIRNPKTINDQRRQLVLEHAELLEDSTTKNPQKMDQPNEYLGTLLLTVG